MIELQGRPGELRFTLQIKRAATGETETVEMVGHLLPADETQELKEAQHGGDSLDSGA
jgi:hypothetical protein